MDTHPDFERSKLILLKMLGIEAEMLLNDEQINEIILFFYTNGQFVPMRILVSCVSELYGQDNPVCCQKCSQMPIVNVSGHK